MISNEEYLERTMRRLQIRRRSALHNGESWSLGPHQRGCPCTTIPYTVEEIRLLESIESLLAELIHTFGPYRGAGKDGRPEWTDIASTT